MHAQLQLQGYSLCRTSLIDVKPYTRTPDPETLVQAEIIQDPAAYVELDPDMARTLLDQKQAVRPCPMYSCCTATALCASLEHRRPAADCLVVGLHSCLSSAGDQSACDLAHSTLGQLSMRCLLVPSSSQHRLQCRDGLQSL